MSAAPDVLDNEKDVQVEQVEWAHNGLEFNDDKKVIDSNLAVAAVEELGSARSTWTVLRRNPKICAIMFAVLLNGIVCGIELNMAGNMMGISSFVKTMGTFNESTNSYAVTGLRWNVWTVASMTQIVGMLVTGSIADYTGRRFIMYLIIFFNMVGATLEATAKDWKMWTAAKLIMGLGTGFMQAGVSTYIGEVAPREIRGIALSTFNLLMNLGNLVSTVICWATAQRWPDIDDDRSWRMPLYVMIALPMIILVAELFLLVESPYWLLMKQRPEKCTRALVFMYPYMNEQEIQVEVAKIAYTLEKEADAQELAKSTSYLDCFRGVDARRTFCAVFPAFCQPLMGHVLSGPYSTYFFSLAGEKDSLEAAAIVQSTCFAANFALYFIIDNPKIGRFTILFVGCAMLTLVTVGIIGSVLPNPAESAVASKLLIAVITIAAAGSVCGPGAAGWTYTAESGSSRLRAKTTTLGNLGNCIGMFVFANTFTYMLTDMALKAAFIFGGFGIVGLVILWFYIPDYTGRSYAQIDELFTRHVPARKFSTTECTGDYGESILL